MDGTSGIPTGTRRETPPAALHSRIIGCAVAVFVAAVGFSHGGYELPASGEIVLLAVWPLLIGAIVGLVPAMRPSGPKLWAACFLAGLVAWSLVSIGWSEAAGRSVAVAVQYAAVLSALMIGAFFFRPGDRNHVLGGLLAGVGIVAAVAVASRLHPDIAPRPTNIAGTERMRARLSWPVGYWNALGFLAAMVIPLGLHYAADARRFVSRLAAGALVPVLAVCVLFTLSRGSILVAIVGVAVGLVLSPLTPRRVLSTLLLAGASAWVVVDALGHGALMDGLTGRGAGAAQASDFQGLLIAASIIAGLASAAIALIPLRGLGAVRSADGSGVSDGPKVRPWLRVGVCGALLAAVVIAGLAAGGGPKVDRAWSDFRSPTLDVAEGRTNSVDRLSAMGSSGRWQLWKGAVDEGNEAPVKGTGAGTFELWWSSNSDVNMVVRNAHSQYLEVYAELGLVGALLMLGFGAALTWGLVVALRRSGGDLGAVGAGAATVACFLVSNAYDWGWQVSVIPIVAMFAFGGASADAREAQVGWVAPIRWRVGVGIASVALIALALPPVVATHALTSSQRLAASGDLTASLSQAKSAVVWQPYSAAGWLQEGLVYDLLGEGKQARAAVNRAIDREPDGWKSWFALSGIEARAGNVTGSLRAYRKARDLNPNSPLFRVGN